MISPNFMLTATVSVLIFFNVSCVLSQNTSVSDETTATTVTITTTQKPNISCETHNGDCKTCVSNSECYYCGTDSKCHFKITKVLTDDKCALKEIHYLTCRLNFQYLLIVIGSLAGIAVLIILIFICICCCKKKGVKISKDDLKWARQREERKQIAAERRKERAEKNEQMRQKYGFKSSNPYQKFDA